MHDVIVVGLLVVFAMAGAVMGLTNCAAVAHDVADGTYAAQVLSCVERATTLAESKACRHDVDARWGLDGGADGHE